MRVLDLFSGIGGFSLGLERAGMRTVAFCEIDSYCRRVLAKHWPGVPCYADIRELSGERLRADGIAVDVICGGFPCTDISVAGKGAGLHGKDSRLWFEYARILGEVRPRYALIENTAGLLGRGLSRILCDLAALGFDAEWCCLRACDFGAPHIRDRAWIIAYPDGRRCEGERLPQHSLLEGASGDQLERLCETGWRARETAADAVGNALWDQSGRRDGPRWAGAAEPGNNGATWPAADAGGERLSIRRGILTWREIANATAAAPEWRLTQPSVCGRNDGIRHRVDRIRVLGNAVIPDIPELLGRAIMSHLLRENQHHRASHVY